MDMTPQNWNPDEMFFTAEEVAARYRVSTSTLANQRSQGVGLPWLKINGKVLYPLSALADAEASGKRGMTREAVKRALHRVFGNSGSDHVDAVWQAIHEEAARD